MKIIYKLTIGFLFISLLVVMQAYIGFTGTTSIQEKYYQLSDGTIPVIENLNIIQDSGFEILHSTNEIIMDSLNNDEYINNELEEIEEYSKIYEEALEIYENKINIFFPDERDYFNDIKSTMQDILRLSSELIYLKKHGGNESQINEKRNQFALSEKKFTTTISLALDKEKDELNERTRETQNAMHKMIINSIVFGLISFLSALVMGSYLSHQISGPIVKLNNASYEISKGNLNTKIEINTNDEIEGLSNTFNKMTLNLKESHDETAAALEEQQQLNEQITKSLEEKEVLLREIHHRVKNNMQVISSLLMLQSENIQDNKYKDIFIESQNRIHAMALIHQKLYQSENLAQINFKEYISGIVANIFDSYGQKSNIKIDIKAENFLIKIDYAIPCGLIINELITNSFKYAFPNGRQGKIQIIAKSNDNDMIQLLISDDGIGIPKDMDIRNTKSLGLQLVTNLAENQLHGQIKLNRDNGTEFQINFRQAK